MQLDIFPQLRLSDDCELGISFNIVDTADEVCELATFTSIDSLIEELRLELAAYGDSEGLFDVSAILKDFSYRFYEQATTIEDRLSGQLEMELEE